MADESVPGHPAPSTGPKHNHLKQKRARSQLSCTPCRHGKLKCNRAHDPACDQCIKRGRQSSCMYLPPPQKHKPAQNVKGRIRQLENLVVDLMNQNKPGPPTKAPKRPADAGGEAVKSTEPSAGGTSRETSTVSFSQLTPPSDSEQFSSDRSQHSAGTPPDDMDAATPLFGQMKISKNEISYVGESHWGAILDSISELKRELDDDDDGEGDSNENGDLDEEQFSTVSAMNNWRHMNMGEAQPLSTTGLGFMLGETDNGITKEKLIANVPEKKIADRLLSLWFNSPDPFKSIIHAPTFQDEYRRFWRNPKGTPVMWLGLLYGIMSLASSFGLRDNDPTSAQAQSVLAEVNKFHHFAASAAVLADFTKPKQYTIECLIVYTAGLRSNNAFVNVWLMVGLIVRSALRMGYHRDSSHYPAISAFHGEMRRRVWSIISMIDVLISFQLGLPSMVKTIQSDTRPPHNLLDRDFGLSTKVLPPGRDVDELTPSSYTRAKLRIVRIFADAAELSHATVAPAYEEMMELDRQLEEAKAGIPTLLQMPEISELVTDPAEQLMCRFNLDLAYLKTKTVLHRRYMVTPLLDQERGVGCSRKICIDSALRVLQHHHTIYTASQPGGQLESVKWYMGSISTHDFLLAAMIICLELSQQLSQTSWNMSLGGGICPQRTAMMEALEKSQGIWAETAKGKRGPAIQQTTGEDEPADIGTMFDETDRASKAMAVMLEKVRKHLGAQAQQMSMPRDGSASAPTAKGDENAPHVGSKGQDLDNLVSPFNGVGWDNVARVRGDFEYGATPAVSSAGRSNGTANHAVPFGTNHGSVMSEPYLSDESSPEGAEMNQMDFTLIADMLDQNTDMVDWELWDNQITKGQALQMSGWKTTRDSDHSDDTMESGTVKFGNALVGGSGTIGPGHRLRIGHDPSYMQQAGSLPMPGNATVLNGTGQISMTETRLNPQALEISDESFAFTGNANGGAYPAVGFNAVNSVEDGGGNVNGSGGGLDVNMLNNVYYDLGVPGYNRNGMYPTTSGEWEDFGQTTSSMT